MTFAQRIPVGQVTGDIVIFRDALPILGIRTRQKGSGSML